MPVGERGRRRELHALPALRPVPAVEAHVRSSLDLPRRLAPSAEGPAGVEEVDDDLLVQADLLGDLLAGVPLPPGDLGALARPCESFYRAETRAGLGMDNRRNAARPGLLFTRPYRRFGIVLRGGSGPRGSGFVAWCSVLGLPDGAPASWSGTGFLGGDRRRVRLTFEPAAEPPLSDLLARVQARAAGSLGYLAYLLTPAVAGEPLAVAGREPVAAAIGRPWSVSGWDQAEGLAPPPDARPAGSVLFYDWEDDLPLAARRERLADLWLQALSPGYGRSGFGRVLAGVWT